MCHGHPKGVRLLQHSPCICSACHLKVDLLSYCHAMCVCCDGVCITQRATCTPGCPPGAPPPRASHTAQSSHTCATAESSAPRHASSPPPEYPQHPTSGQPTGTAQHPLTTRCPARRLPRSSPAVKASPHSSCSPLPAASGTAPLPCSGYAGIQETPLQHPPPSKLPRSRTSGSRVLSRGSPGAISRNCSAAAQPGEAAQAASSAAPEPAEGEAQTAAA
jgi:hypothetical protein